jgi:hypothetical protein
MAVRQVIWPARLQDLPADARALMAQDRNLGLYAHPAWLENLARQVRFEPGLAPAYVCLQRSGATQIVLPLLLPVARPAATAPWRLARARSLANYYSPLAGPSAAPEADEEDWLALCSALRRPPGPDGQRPRLDALQLAPLADSGTAPAATSAALRRALSGAGWRVRPYFCFGNWYQELAAAGDPGARWAAYWSARDGALRSTAARMGRRFRHAGGRFEIVSGGDRLAPALAAYAEVYRHSWKAAEPHPGFIPGLARAAAAQGWLRLGLAWLEGRAVAAQLWLVHQGKADIYKLAYREDSAALSPGTLLTEHLMHHVFHHDRVRELDYLMGDDPYKQQWMGQRRERWGLEALNPDTGRGRLAIVGSWIGALKPQRAARRPLP